MHLPKEFVVKFSGLSLGKHDFEFEVNDSFFEHFNEPDFEKSSIGVSLQLEKKSTMLELDLEFHGTINVPCDRCTDMFDLDVKGGQHLIVKFGTEQFDQTDDIIILEPEAYEFNVAPQVFELITLNLPLKKVHPEGECNREMLESIEKYAVHEDEEAVDPRWDALKGLKEETDKE